MSTLDEQREALLQYALTFPEAWKDTPWGDEPVAKVRKKVFVFLGHTEGTLSMSVKLPTSMVEVLEEPFAKPTGYGLGRWGWVSVSFTDPEQVPMDRMRDWIDESYCVVAPKTVVKKYRASLG